MSTTRCRQRFHEGHTASGFIYVGVLDLRARCRGPLARKLQPYCVLRYGADQHHRTPSFPPEGLKVPARRTTVDDRQLPASEMDGSAGILWEGPASLAALQHRRTSSQGLEQIFGGVRDQQPLRQEEIDGQDGCPAESLLLEFYNDADTYHSGDPLEGFEADALGVLKVNISDLLVPHFETRPSGHDDMPGEIPKRWPEGCGSANQARDGVASDVKKPAPHAQVQNGGAKPLRFRNERWVGGVVFPTPDPQHESGNVSSRRGFIVEALLVAEWEETRAARFSWPMYDSFGQAVHPRNARKCSSAHDLWALQEPLQLGRWMSDAGRAAWFKFQGTTKCVDKPALLHRKTKARGDDRIDWRDELRELVWKGVPADMREEVYMSLSGASLKRKLCGEEYYQNLLNDCHQLVDESNTYNMTRMHAQDRRECCHGDTVVHPVGEGQDVRHVACPEIKSPTERPRRSLPVKIHNAASNTFECDECTHAQYTKRSSPRTSCPTCRASSGDQPRGGILRAQSTHVVMEERMGNGQTANETLNHHNIQDGPRELKLQRWKEIEADLDRVFVNGRTRVNTSAGTASMRRVLRAYSLRNPAVGYCQGMNFVVGLLLQVVSEETTFWLLAAFCEDLHPDYHTKSMLRARSDIAALKDIVRRELPRFHARAAEVGMPLELKLTQWLVVGFINCFPPHVALRILEVSFLEGSEVSLATALAFLRLHEAEILEGEDIAQVVSTLDQAQSGMYEADILLAQVWRELAVVGKDIRAARAWHLNRMQREQDAEANARRARDASSREASNTHSSESQDTDNDRGGWLRGRVSVGAGSTWLFLVPESLAGQVEAMHTTLNRQAFATTDSLFVDGKLARTSLAPLIVGGVRWLMGWRTFQA